jgi:ribonucleoside-triphosphate reductase
VLPHDGGSYKQAPFESCSKETYEEMMKSLVKIDLMNVIEYQDETDLSGELACSGGSCELK